MGNREIFNRIITERKTKSSNKKPKYGMRKLTVGVVSCLLGYMMFFTPNVSQAEKVKETPQVASEVVAPLSETNTVEVNNPEVSNKNEEAEVTAKPATEEKVIAAEATQERKQSEDFNAEIKEIEVEKNGVVNYKEAITNLPADADVKPSAEIDTSKIEKHTISVDINFADGSTTTVNITINVIEKANADKPNDLELGEKIGSDQSVKAPADNIVEPDPSIPFGKTKARVEIEKKGINGGKFPFDTIFESGTTKVTLVTVDENGDDVETTATINATTGEMTFNNIVDMQAVKDGDVFIEFNGEKIKGKFIDSYEGPDYGQGGATNITTFKLILNQIRNTDVVVNTKDKSGNVVDNPTTEVTNGKIKKGDTEVDIPKKDNVIEIDDIKGLSSEEIDDFNNNTPEYSVKGTENGFLVNKDGNKVYKPGEFKIDEKGLDPTELEFTEKPLVTDKDQTGDTDYVTVTFESGEHGTISGSTIYYVIKGVDIGNNLSAPNVTGKDGWSYKGWNAELKNKYESNTKYSAIYEKKTTEAIPAEVKYEADDSLDFEEKKVEKAPVDGEKEVTTVSETGKDDVVTENIITPAEDGVTKVGNKKVETKTNEDGSTTETTTIYDVDPDTGELTNPTVTNEKTTKKTTEAIPGKVKYEADDSLDFEEKKVEKAPVDGEKEVTTVSETGKDDVVTENIITPAEDGVTKVGNKKVETKTNEDGSTTETTTIYDVDPDTGELTNPTVTNEKTTKKTTEAIPGKVKYEADDSLDFEEKKVEKAPVDGEKEVTTVSETGKDDVVTENIITPAEDGVTKVGNKKVETKTNEDGSTTETTTIYDVDPDTGELTNPTVTNEKTTKKTTEAIPGKVKYEADDSLDFEEKKVEKAPVDGEKEVTTVSETGKDDVVTENIITPAEDGVTKVGNKKVETKTNEDGSTTETTTIYDVDPDTGELTNPTVTNEKTTKKTTEAIPGKVKYEADDSLDFEEKKVEKAPVDGEKEVTTVSETGKDDVVTENIITPAEDGVTKVGNKKVETKTNEDGSTTETTTIYDVDPDTGELTNPTVTNEKTTKKTTEAIPGKVKYEADDSLDFEEKKVEKAPVDGEKEVTTVSETGKDDVVTENIITPAEDGVTKVGNKKVETKTNEDGSTTETTTIYDVDPDTGELTNPTVTNEKTTKKTTEAIPGKVKYEADDSLDFEEKKVEKAPVDGEKEVTTVSETGKDDVVTENIITPAEDGVTKVGNKKVETKTNEDGSTTETTTIYDVDPDTGELTNPTVTTKTTPAEEYLAIFNGNGGNPTTQKVTVKDGEVVSGVTEPTREGYKFVKWVKLGTDKEFDLSKPFSKDILGGEKSVIFSAVWEKVVSGDTTAPTIDAGNITAVEGQPIPPVMVDVDDVNAKVTVEDLPEGLKYNPETKQIEGTIPKAEDWGYKEEKTITATIKAVDEAGNESTKEITVTILRDTDGDGTPDVTDTDDDNDGVDDKTEKEKGTDPKDKDSKPSTTAESTDPTIPEKTGVKDPEKLTDREKEEVKNKIEEANKDKFPEGTKVDVDDKGNATITYPDESKDTIPAEDLVFQYKHGDPEIDDRPELPISDIIEPTVPGKTDVGDKDNLTDKEKEEIKDKIEEANKDNFPEGTKVEVDDKGNVTITYPDESTDTIPADKVVEQKEEVDKSELQKEVDKKDDTKASDKYKNADQDKKDAYDKALEDAKKVLENKDATQEEVDKAKDALKAAEEALNGKATQEVDKSELQKEVDKKDDTKASDKYKNADQDKKDAYDKALEDAKKVLENKDATQEEVDKAKDALKAAEEALNGKATQEVDKSELQKEVDKKDDTKASDKYKNADQDKKDAYDKALEEAKKVLENKDATQEEVDKAKDALKAAEEALNGKATQEVDKSELQKEVDKKDDTKASDKYKNADQDKKAAYDKALEDAKKVLENKDATQEEVDKAKDALKAAEEALNGKATQEVDKSELQKEVDKKDDTKASDKYKNADQDKKDAYDKALEDAKKVLENKDATQEEVDKAKDALKAAEEALNGKATQEVDKSELQKEVDKKDDTKASDKYKNADQDKKDAYDKALEDAKKVLENKDATQEEVDKAKDALKAAEEALNGKATQEVDKSELQKEVDKKDDTKASDKYKNADQDKKDAYDKALEDAKKVLENKDATQEEVDKAKDALKAAEEALNGKATQEVDKSELQKEVDKKDDTKASDKYKNADQDKKDAYDKALEDAKKVLENKDATQEEVNKAKEDLAKAEEALNGKATQEVDADKVDPAVPGKTKVEDSSNLTKDEKDKVKEAIEKANKDKFPQGTKVEIGNDGSATITYPDESKDTIKGSDLVEKIADAPTRPSKPSKQDKPSKNLPKAGIESEAMMMAAAALSTLGGLYVSRKKKEDER